MQIHIYFSDLLEGKVHASCVFVLLSLLTQKEGYCVCFLHLIHIIFLGCHSLSVHGDLPDFSLQLHCVCTIAYSTASPKACITFEGRNTIKIKEWKGNFKGTEKSKLKLLRESLCYL